MQEATIQHRIKSIMETDAQLSGHKDLFVGVLIENLRQASSGTSRAYLLVLGFGAAFTFLVVGTVPKVTIAGVDFTGKDGVVLCLLVATAFCLYRVACLNQLAVLTKLALDAYYEVAMPIVSAHRIVPLLRPPASVFDVEDIIDEVTLGRHSVSLVSKLGALIVTVGPLCWFGWSLWWVWTIAILGVSLKIIVTALVAIFVAAAVWVIRRTLPLH